MRLPIGVLVAAILAVAIFFSYGPLFRASGPEACVKPTKFEPGEGRVAGRVFKVFLEHAVVRNHPAARPEKAWGLVTSDIKGSNTRESWVGGNIPVVPYPTTHPETVNMILLDAQVVTPSEIKFVIRLSSSDIGPDIYRLVMVRRCVGGEWKISYWMPEGGFVAPPTGSQ